MTDSGNEDSNNSSGHSSGHSSGDNDASQSTGTNSFKSNEFDTNKKQVELNHRRFAESISKIEHLHFMLQQTNADIHGIVGHLQKSKSTFGEQYFWVVFLVMYGAIFLFQ